MSIGTYFMGVGLLLLIAAYVGSPLRRTKFDADAVTEQWVSDARRQLKEASPSSGEESAQDITTVVDVVSVDVVDDDSVNFCPQCGRRVEEEHRFCPGCGTPLTKGAVR